MRINKLVTLFLVACLCLASGQSSKAVAESAALDAEREKLLRTLQQVRENFESADEGFIIMKTQELNSSL